MSTLNDLNPPNEMIQLTNEDDFGPDGASITLADSQQEFLEFELDDATKADRLDKVLAALLPQHSRNRLQGWIEQGWVTVNQSAAKTKQIVGAGDRLQVWQQPAAQDNSFTPEPVEFEVVAKSVQWIVVNKPSGLVTHPGAGNWSGTLLNGLLYRFPELAQIARAGIVHRLDKDTSGLLVVARTETAQTNLVRQLQARTVGREYQALVKGRVSPEGVVDKAIGRDSKVPVKMSVTRPIAPKQAITHFICQRHGMWHTHDVSQVICRLQTGRTHQIRVHMSSLMHPLLGDQIYGGPLWAGAQRQMLHAWRLHFNDPSDGQERQFEAPIPADMGLVMQQINWANDND